MLNENGIGSKEKLETLEVIVHSEQFRNCPRLSGFLSYVVKEEIAGRQTRLKALSIAMEVYGRSVDFDPQSNALIRVEAGRLRKALEIFYAKHRTTTILEISIPKGSYVPTYRRQNGNRFSTEEALEQEDREAEKTTKRVGEVPIASLQRSAQQRPGSRYNLGQTRLPPSFMVDFRSDSIHRSYRDGLETSFLARQNRPSTVPLEGGAPNVEPIGRIDGKRLKSLEDENAKLKRLLADAILDNLVLKDLLSKKW